LGGMLMQASTLITIIIIFVAVVLFSAVEVYRKQKFKVATTVA
jgi:hypothetical protein